MPVVFLDANMWETVSCNFNFHTYKSHNTSERLRGIFSKSLLPIYSIGGQWSHPSSPRSGLCSTMSGSLFRSEPMSKGQVIALFRNDCDGNDCDGNGNGSLAVIMISVAMANVIESLSPPFPPWSTFLPFSTFPVLLATRGGLQLRRPAGRAW